MKIFANLAATRLRTLLIFLAGVVILICAALYRHLVLDEHPHNLVCRANLQIVRDNVAFEGILDFKAGNHKGIANINGIVTVSPQEEYTVQRTVLFTHSDYGLSPVWTSRRIVISNRETVPPAILQQVLPDFYLKGSSVSDVDVFVLTNDARLITREGIPYFYCQQYLLPDEKL
jgi:hypothetical protein